MLASTNLTERLRNISIYLVGVALFVVGTLGLAGAILLTVPVSAVLFSLGILLVLAVHEYFGGPI